MRGRILWIGFVLLAAAGAAFIGSMLAVARMNAVVDEAREDIYYELADDLYGQVLDKVQHDLARDAR